VCEEESWPGPSQAIGAVVATVRPACRFVLVRDGSGRRINGLLRKARGKGCSVDHADVGLGSGDPCPGHPLAPHDRPAVHGRNDPVPAIGGTLRGYRLIGLVLRWPVLFCPAMNSPTRQAELEGSTAAGPSSWNRDDCPLNRNPLRRGLEHPSSPVSPSFEPRGNPAGLMRQSAPVSSTYPIGRCARGRPRPSSLRRCTCPTASQGL